MIEQEVEDDGLWSMGFDGVVRKEGSRASVWVITPKYDKKKFSFKMYLECTNNFTEYEAVILGLNFLK